MLNDHLLRRATPWKRVAVVLPWLAIVSPSAISAQPTAVQDSSGVRIISNGSPDDTRIAFRINPNPRLDLGGDRDGTPAELDTHHRDHLALQMSDGRILVTDRTELKTFGPDGEFRGAFGGEGDGPGEFRHLIGVCITPGDTIIASGRDGRISIFDGNGEHVQTSRKPGWHHSEGSCFQDGSSLFKGPRRPNPTTTYPADVAYVLDPVVEVRRIAPDGTDLGSAGLFPEGLLGPWFQSTGNISAHDAEIVSGNGTKAEFRVHSTDGRLMEIVRWDQPLTPVTDEVLADAVRSGMPRGTLESEFQPRFSRARRAPQPHTLPAYTDIKVDGQGRIWVQDYYHGSPFPLPWTVFDSSGNLLGRVFLPSVPPFSQVDIRSIDADEILLWWRDEIGFVHLSYHSLEVVQ